MARAEGDRAIVVGGDVIRSILSTGDHARFFIGAYEPLVAAYIDPGQLYDDARLDQFTGREWLTAELDAFLAAHDRGYFVIEAGAGLGKTTFLAWLTRTRGYVQHFVRLAPPGPEGIAAGLRNLAAQLVRAWQLDPELVEGSLPTAALRPQFLTTILQEAVRARDARRPGEPIVLVVDGLDEAGRLPGQNALGLPRQLPAGVYVIASQRPVEVTLQVDTPRRVLRIVADDERNLRDARSYLHRAARRPTIARTLDAAGWTVSGFVEALQERCSGVWIYLIYVLRELEQGQRSLSELERLPFGLWQYYAQYWDRWRDEHADGWDGTHLPLLATLAVAREPLSFTTLCALAGVAPPPRRLLEVSWRSFLTVRRDREPSYALYHASLGEFLRGQRNLEDMTIAEEALVDELEQAARQAHHRLAGRYLEAWGGIGQTLPGLHDQTLVYLDGGYGLRHVAEHLVEAGREGELHQLLSLEWPGHDPAGQPVNAWYSVEGFGDDARYLADVAIAWRAAGRELADADGNRSDSIGLQLRYALITASVNSVAASVPPNLLAALVAHGTWTPARGLAYARKAPTARSRVAALAALAPHLAEPVRVSVLREALAAVGAIPDGPSQARALTSLAPHLPGSLLEGALTAVSAIAGEPGRADGLAALTPQLPESLLERARTLAATIEREPWRTRALVAVAARLPEPEATRVVAEALAACRAVADPRTRAEAFAAAAERLPPPMRIVALRDALAAAEAIDEEPARAETLSRLARLLPESLVTQALTVAGGITDQQSKARALAAFGPHLPPRSIHEIRLAMQQDGDPQWRAGLVAELAPFLPAPLQRELLGETLVMVQAIDDERARAASLAQLSGGLTEPLLADALRVAATIERPQWRAQVINALSPHLSPTLLPEALAITLMLSDEPARIRALVKLSAYLPSAQLASLLATTETVADARLRAQVVVSLASRLDSTLLPLALAIARTVDGEERARTLGSLAPRLPHLLLLDALALARRIQDPRSRAKALGVVGEHLPEPAHTAAFTEALEAAQRLPSESLRAEALGWLAPHLPASLLGEAVAAVRALHDGALKSRLLGALVPRLPSSLLPSALAAVQEIKEHNARVDALLVLAPHLPPPLLADALSLAQAVGPERDRAAALAVLAPHLPPSLAAEVLDATRGIRYGPSSVRILAALAPHLPPTLLPDALATASEILDERARAEALTALAPHLPPTLLPDALTTARAAGRSVWCTLALAAFAARAEEPLRWQLHSEILADTRTLDYDAWRARILAALAPHLPPTLLPDALATASEILDERARAEALTALAPHLPPTLLPNALTTAGAIGDEHWKAHTLAALAPHLQATLLPDALTTASEILDERARAEALTALAPHLPPTLLPDALTTASAMGDEHWKARTLAALAPCLSAALADQAFQNAANLQDDGDRAQVLESLATLQANSSPMPDLHRWTGVLWMLAIRRRRNLLDDLCALAPLIAKSGGQPAVGRAVAAIEDVGRWWP